MNAHSPKAVKTELGAAVEGDDLITAIAIMGQIGSRLANKLASDCAAAAEANQDTATISLEDYAEILMKFTLALAAARELTAGVIEAARAVHDGALSASYEVAGHA